MQLQDYRKDLILSLDEVYDRLGQTAALSKIFDKDWYDIVKKEIQQADLTHDFTAIKSEMFLEFEDWLARRPNRIATLDERILAFRTILFRQDVVCEKFKRLGENRFKSMIKCDLFELAVLGFFAREHVLTNIEVPMGATTRRKKSTNVDGEVTIDGRPILVEVTHTEQKLHPSGDGPSVYSMSREHPIRQMEEKIKKKFEKNGKPRQLGLANCSVVLAIARNFWHADKEQAREAVQRAFHKFKKLSGVIMADSWWLINSQFYLASSPENPLTQKESDTLRVWFNKEESF